MMLLTILILISSLSFMAYGIAYFKTPEMKSEFKRFGLEKVGTLTAILEILGAGGLLVGLKFLRDRQADHAALHPLRAPGPVAGHRAGGHRRGGDDVVHRGDLRRSSGVRPLQRRGRGGRRHGEVRRPPARCAVRDRADRCVDAVWLDTNGPGGAGYLPPDSRPNRQMSPANAPDLVNQKYIWHPHE